MFKDKEQVLIVPVNYVSHINNGFTGSDLKTKNSYSLYDSIGIYKPLYEIRKNICLIEIKTLSFCLRDWGTSPFAPSALT